MIAVTGGAGFIGSGIIWELNRRGLTDILVPEEMDRLGVEKKANLRNLKINRLIDHYEFLKGFENGDFNLDCIFHLGACSATTETDRNYIMATNYEYTRRLASIATEKGVRLIYASSAATYGDGSKGFSDQESLLKNFTPMNYYGESKHLFDLWALENGLFKEIVGLKYFNVYGPNEYHKGDMRSFIIKAFEQISDTGGLRLFKSENPDYSDGGQKRDFIYLKDAVDITMFFYDHPSIGGIYNAGTGMARTWNDLALAIFDALKKEAKINYIPLPDVLKDQYQYYTEADISKLEKAGYGGCNYTLEDGVADYITGYLNSNRRLIP